MNMLSDVRNSAMDEIHTSIEIDAPPTTVWEVLTGFEDYTEWNPRMIVTGRAETGVKLTVAPGPEAGRMPTFRTRVLRAVPDREFVWLGHLFVPGLYDGEHRFVIENLGDGRSRLVQSERFSGLLVDPINRRFGEETEAGFHAANAALKARAESLFTERGKHNTATATAA